MVDVQSLSSGANMVVMTLWAEAGLVPGSFGEKLNGRGAGQVMGIPPLLQALSPRCHTPHSNRKRLSPSQCILRPELTRCCTNLAWRIWVVIRIPGRAVLELVLTCFGMVFMGMLIVGELFLRVATSTGPWLRAEGLHGPCTKLVGFGMTHKRM
ncbi:unnamed protein product [Prorocentrum cordatum]|uniref:Copper transporter n=1 Tax=Prorocentrum cordatum TaxID=2364126 RepID=A0ABN9WSD9_9DINO|nr:unnamed protein product [Polarella glacialis]